MHFLTPRCGQIKLGAGLLEELRTIRSGYILEGSRSVNQECCGCHIPALLKSNSKHPSMLHFSIQSSFLPSFSYWHFINICRPTIHYYIAYYITYYLTLYQISIFIYFTSSILVFLVK